MNKILPGRLKIRNFSSCVEKYFTRSLRSLMKYFSTLEEKFRISAQPFIKYHDLWPGLSL